MVWPTAILASCLLVSLDNKRVTAQQLPEKENAKVGGSAGYAGVPASPSRDLDGVVERPDLIYRTIDGKTLMLDMVCPQSGEGLFPAVILLHGAGPANKGRKGMAPLAQLLARQRYVGIAVSYRCKPEEAFPAPIQDVQCAIRWLRAHADQYKIDRDRIGVVGYSGGGALACLLGLKGDGPDDENKLPEKPGRVQAVVSFYGPTDFARLHEWCTKRAKATESCTADRIVSGMIMQALEKWLGGPPSKDPQLYESASPISCASKNSPPILLIHGADDSVVPLEQSQLFARKLQKAGRPVSLLVVEGAGHDFEEKNKSDGRLAFAAVLAFLNDHLLGVGQNQPSGNHPDLPKDLSGVVKNLK
jgi:acetyl esterase/lipase